jgi:hypothetical protein
MKVSCLTLNVAWQITSDRQLLNDFYKYTDVEQFVYFAHTPFFTTIQSLEKFGLIARLVSFAK